MKLSLEGKICVVTGGNKGIGRCVVEKFAAADAKLVYALGRDEAALKEVEALYSNIKAVKLDVTDVEGIKAFVKATVAEHGNIDVLVNNAGVTADKPIKMMKDEDWDYVININLKGIFNMAREIGPVMTKNKIGSIINIASIVGIDGNIGQTNYAAAKGGVIAMTKTWAKEFARKGAQVRVNAVAPGFTQTAMTDKIPEKYLDMVKEKILLGKLGQTDDIANACLFFASEASSYITSQVLRVDGGMII